MHVPELCAGIGPAAALADADRRLRRLPPGTNVLLTVPPGMYTEGALAPPPGLQLAIQGTGRGSVIGTLRVVAAIAVAVYDITIADRCVIGQCPSFRAVNVLVGSSDDCVPCESSAIVLDSVGVAVFERCTVAVSTVSAAFTPQLRMEHATVTTGTGGLLCTGHATLLHTTLRVRVPLQCGGLTLLHCIVIMEAAMECLVNGAVPGSLPTCVRIGGTCFDGMTTGALLAPLSAMGTVVALPLVGGDVLFAGTEVGVGPAVTSDAAGNSIAAGLSVFQRTTIAGCKTDKCVLNG